MMEDDEGVGFKSSQCFNSIRLPARTAFVFRLAGNISVGLA
jgi:hypothetical protein